LNFELDARSLEAVLALASVTVGFIAYWFISQSAIMENYFSARYPNPDKQILYFVLFQRYMGVVFLGILPIIIMMIFAGKSWADYGVKIPESFETLWWILGLVSLVIPINYLNAKKADNLLVYPQIRSKYWTIKVFVHEYSSWIAYLLAYELLFRGFLLFSVYRVAGAWTAMLVNVAIYAIAHVPKGQKEAVGAIPLGMLLSYLTLKTGDIWIAVVVHIALALSNSFFSFLAQPAMYYKKK